MKIINRLLPILFYLLFILTPLIMSPYTSELFEFNKMIFIYLVTVSILFLWILKMIVSKKVLFKKTPLDIPILIFLASQVLSTVFSIDPHTSIFGYYGRFNGGLLSIIAYIVLFYGYVSNMDKEKTFKLLKLSAFTALVVVLLGLPGKMGYDTLCFVFTGKLTNNCWTDQFRPAERMFSTLGQPNWLGAYLVVHFFIGAVFLLYARKRNILLCLITYEILIYIGILFSRSRSAIFSLAGGVFLFFLYYFINQKHNRLLALRNIAICIFVLFFFLRIFNTGIELLDKPYNFSFPRRELITTLKLKKDQTITESFDIRKIVWEGAWKLGNQYPLFGTGVETFGYSYFFVRPKEHNLTSEWDYLYNKAHNEYLNYFATTGYIGVGSYFLMICVFIILVLRNIKNSHLLLLIAYLSLLISNFFGFSTSTIQLFFYLIPAFCIVLMGNSTIGVHKQSNVRMEKKQYGMFIILINVFIYGLVYLTSYYLADILYAKSEASSQTDDYQESVNLLRDALSLRYEHVYQDKISYALASLAYVASSQKQSDMVEKLVNLSTLMNTTSLQNAPYNVLYWKNRAKIYYLFYQISTDKNAIDTAIQALQQAEKLSPTDPKISYSLSVFYSILFDESKENEKTKYENLSLQEISKAIELKSNYRDAYFLKAQMYEKYEDKENARKTLLYILKNVTPNDPETKEQLLKL